MRTIVAVTVLSAAMACDGGGGAGLDATPGDDGALHDAAVDDDAAPDAAVVDDCPNRTAPVGQPGAPVATAEIHSGDAVVRSTLDVQVLAGKRVITGSLVIETAADVTIELPDLEVVGVALEARGAATVKLPKLETVGGRISAFAAVEFSMPRLETVGSFFTAEARRLDFRCLRRAEGQGGDAFQMFTFGGVETTELALPKLESALLRIGGMPALTRLDLPQFRTGALYIGTQRQPAGLPALTSVSLPALEHVTALEIGGAPVVSVTLKPGAQIDAVTLQQLPELPDLAWLEQATVRYLAVFGVDRITTLGAAIAGLEAFDIYNNARLMDVSALAGITRVEGGAFIARNPELANVALTSLTTVNGIFVVTDNAKLTSLEAPVFTTVTNAEENQIASNPLLPNCQATEIRNRVAPSGGYIRVANNRADTCR